eukprot:215807-Chlamydomonas_euryale.AAC.1
MPTTHFSSSGRVMTPFRATFRAPFKAQFGVRIGQDACHIPISNFHTPHSTSATPRRSTRSCASASTRAATSR